MSSTYNDALNLVQGIVQAQAFTLNSVSIPCVIRSLPTKQEQIDPAVQYLVCPDDRPERWRRFAFGGHREVTSFIAVVLVAPNNADYSTNLPTYLSQRQTLEGALQPALVIPVLPATTPVLLRQEVTYDPPIDRARVSDNYDYLGLGLSLTVAF